jgi:hypothetical protein
MWLHNRSLSRSERDARGETIMKMNLKAIQRTTATVVLAACAAALPAAARSLDDNDRHAAGRGLEGTWVVQVTRRDCSSGAPLGIPFYSLLTFAQGGTMTETTANSMFYPAERGPGHGVWSHVKGGGYGDASDRRYQARSLALITSNGVLVQEQIIRQKIQMGNKPNVFQTTSASIEFYKPDGSLLAKGCATAQGTRF